MGLRVSDDVGSAKASEIGSNTVGSAELGRLAERLEMTGNNEP